MQNSQLDTILLEDVITTTHNTKPLSETILLLVVNVAIYGMPRSKAEAEIELWNQYITIISDNLKKINRLAAVECIVVPSTDKTYIEVHTI